MLIFDGKAVVFVFLEIFLCVQGNSDVIIRVKDSNESYINVSFSLDLFEQYHNCLCYKRRTCNGFYASDYNIYYIRTEVKTVNDERYYVCKNQNRFVLCSRVNENPEGPVNQEIKCKSSGIVLTLIWENINEGFVFNDHSLCAMYCASGCYCLVETTSTTRSTTLVATTSTTRSTSLVPTTSTTRSTSLVPTTSTTRSTSLIATTSTTRSTSSVATTSLATSSPPSHANSTTNDSDDGPQLGVIIGVVIAVIIIATVIAVVGIFLWRRKHRHNTSVPQYVTNISTDTEEVGSSRSLPQDTQNNSPYYNMVSVSSSRRHLDSNSGEAVTNTSTGTHPFDNAMSLQPDKVTDKENKVLYYSMVSVPSSASHLDGNDDAADVKPSEGTAGFDDSKSVPRDKLTDKQGNVPYYNVGSM